MDYVIITGATSGIGRELAFTYAKNGHHLILIARRYELLLSLKNELEGKYSVSIVCYSCDLNKMAEVYEVFKNINEMYSINCLINNAGMGIFESIREITLKTLLQQNNINFNSPVLITKLLIDNIDLHKGSIINICSVLSYLPNKKSSIYVANKHALYGFSNSIRLEYPNMHILTIHPATVKTNFFKDSTYFTHVKTVLTPQTVAKKIYHAYIHGKRKLNIPKSVSILSLGYSIFPRLIDKINIKYFSNK